VLHAVSRVRLRLDLAFNDDWRAGLEGGGEVCDRSRVTAYPETEPRPNRVLSPDKRNRNKPPIFIALRLHPALFESLPQNHCSILYNPFIQFGTFPGANSTNRVAGKVNLSKKYNPPSQHLEFLRTVEANI
jgi:hypothetical protein